MPLRLAVFGLVGVAMAIGGVHGGTAYVPSVRLPIILFVFGVFIAARRRRPPDPNLRLVD